VDLAGFLMTPDAAFGHERRGTPETLAELGARSGFEVVVTPPLELDERPVRSGTVRVDIAAGDLNGARRLLGRPVAVAGDVVDAPAVRPGHGPTRLHFPVPVALPPEGIYRVTVEPAWTAAGRVGPPVRSRAEVTADGLTLPGRGHLPDRSRLRVAFTAAVAAPGSDAG
jgi:FAD synthase